MSSPLLVVGSVGLDSVETPHGSWNEVIGGAASYFAAAASLIVPVRLVGVVGEDFPQAHVDFLAERGVDLKGLQCLPGRTFRWTGRYHENMVDRDTLDTQLNVFEQFQPQIPEDYRNTPYVFLANIQPDLQLQVLDQVAQPKYVALDTMNFWMTEAHLPQLKKVLARVSTILINDEEARLLSGEHNLVKAAEAVRRMGVQSVVVKRGDAGALLFDDAGMFAAPALPLEDVVDPTGAGDTFAAGFMAMIAHAEDTSPATLRKAMALGTVVASFTVEGASVDRLRTLTKSDLRQRSTALKTLVSFDPIEI